MFATEGRTAGSWLGSGSGVQVIGHGFINALRVALETLAVRAGAIGGGTVTIANTDDGGDLGRLPSTIMIYSFVKKKDHK